jgi:hypothetical protein
VVLQVWTINASVGNRMTALKQVENAVHWLGRDAQMAQYTTPAGASGFPLNLQWVEWDNTDHDVTYSIVDGRLQRAESIDGLAPVAVVLASHIDSNAASTNCSYTDGALSYKITSKINGFRSANEARVSMSNARPAP